jgi:hypothetical protein
MTFVISGLNWKNEPCAFHLDDNIKKNLDSVKEVVLTKDFDFVALICGLPGLGKSNLAINLAKYLDPNFTEENIAFTDEDFISKTNSCPKHSAIILDESFASLNSKVTQTKEFLRIINHLQIIRQKNLFIIFCLPNFFDLSKGIALYRSSYLFVTYGKEFGDRGRVAVFGRPEKKNLYIIGQKFMNYDCVQPNFRARFVKQKAISDERYLEMKLNHLKSRKIEENIGQGIVERDKLIAFCKVFYNIPIKQLLVITNLSKATIYKAIQSYKIEIEGYKSSIMAKKGKKVPL